MTIFFIGSIRGGRAHQIDYATIVSALEKHGTVLGKHISDDSLSEYGETKLSSGEVLAREQKTLESADIVVAEVTAPSLGVGYLIASAKAAGKRVVALYRGSDDLKLSALVKGDANVEVRLYETSEDINRILDGALAQ